MKGALQFWRHGSRYLQMQPGGAFRFHRAELQQALVSRLTGQLLLSHRLISYEETNNEVCLQFLGGKSATCDLLVGMDGINSAVRKCFLLKHGVPKSLSLHPIWTGTVAYRGLVPIEKLEVKLPGHRAVHTPMIVSRNHLLPPYHLMRI